MPAPKELTNQITSLDGKGYKSYKTLQGKSFAFSLFDLTFEHVQGDPFRHIPVYPSRSNFSPPGLQSPTTKIR